MTDVISVRFRSGCKEYYFDPKGLTIPAGTDVIVETAQGPEFAHCAAGNHQVPDDAVVKPLRSVLRIATDNDKHTAAYNRSREKEAFDVCKKKIQQHKLEMKLVRVELALTAARSCFSLPPTAAWTSASWSRTWPACSAPASSCGRSASATRPR